MFSSGQILHGRFYQGKAKVGICYPRSSRNEEEVRECIWSEVCGVLEGKCETLGIDYPFYVLTS